MCLKRLFDIVCSIVGIVILFPVLLIISISILITDGSPIIFSQIRVGQNGKEFILRKFRTMNIKAGINKGTFEPGDRTRITNVGRFLRTNKLDELPQLWNVLKGEMSLVGPRPEVSNWVDAYPDHWDRSLTVRPGITDPGAIEFRNEEDILAAQSDSETYYRNVILLRKLDLYEKYVQTRSFWGDLRILLRTVWAMIVR